MENPIIKIREDLDISRKDFAFYLDVAETTLWNYENGKFLKIEGSILLDRLEEIGFDRERLIEEYEKYREELQTKLIEEIG